MPASRTLSHNSPAKSRPTHQAAVPQTPATDRHHARPNALDDGTPTERQNADARRNAVDGALPAMLLPSMRSLLQQAPAPPTTRGMPVLPVCLPALRAGAPSLYALHPYSSLGLRQVGSGNYLPPPPSTHCAECKMDLFIAHLHQKNLDRGCRPVVPDPQYRAANGDAFILFSYEGERGCRVAGQPRPGVLVADILGFNANIAGAGQKLVRAGVPGPMLVSFEIEGLGKVPDVIYGNCMHRPITHFNMACALSLAFYCLARFTYSVDPRKLALTSLISTKNCTEWVASARFVDRIG
ncbi:hypothetical protein B0H12DRAFT_1224180 [Mycena haematopus]|nr:hypothetical protein B0H12DRAFT_1224180 [Mycena haematopus]